MESAHQGRRRKPSEPEVVYGRSVDLWAARHAQEERSECGQFGYASESSGGFIINRERTCSEIAAEDSEEEEQEEE